MNEFPFGYVKNKQGQDSHAIADWKHIDGKPTDLVDKPTLDTAIAGIPKPDLSAYLTQASLAGYALRGELPDFKQFALKTDLPTFDPKTVYTKDEVNAAIAKVKTDIITEFTNGSMKEALGELKALKDALTGEDSQLNALFKQLALKANVGDSYLKSEEDAKFATKGELPDFSKFAAKADIPDVSGMAKQADLSQVENYAMFRNHWVQKYQTVGYSLDSNGEATVLSPDSKTTTLIDYDPAAHLVFVGWGAAVGKQVTVGFFDKDKKYLSSTIWTITSKGAGDNPRSIIEFYKNAPTNTAFIKVSCNFMSSADLMIVSSVFDDAAWMAAPEDVPNLDGTVAKLSDGRGEYGNNGDLRLDGTVYADDIKLSGSSDPLSAVMKRIQATTGSGAYLPVNQWKPETLYDVSGHNAVGAGMKLSLNDVSASFNTILHVFDGAANDKLTLSYGGVGWAQNIDVNENLINGSNKFDIDALEPKTSYPSGATTVTIQYSKGMAGAVALYQRDVDVNYYIPRSTDWIKPGVEIQSVTFTPLNGFKLDLPFTYETVKFGPNAQLINLHGSVGIGGPMKAFSSSTIGVFTNLPKPVTNQYGNVVGSLTASGWGKKFVVNFDSTGTQLIALTPSDYPGNGDEIYIDVSFFSEEAVND